MRVSSGSGKVVEAAIARENEMNGQYAVDVEWSHKSYPARILLWQSLRVLKFVRGRKYF